MKIIEQTWDEIMIEKPPRHNGKESNCKPYGHENCEEKNELNSKEYRNRESAVEQKSCANEIRKPDDNEVVLDFRIPDETVKAEGKPISTVGKSDEGDHVMVVRTVEKDKKSGEQEEKGKINSAIDANSSPTSGVEDEIRKKDALSSPVSPQRFPATAKTFKSSSALNGIDADEQYPSQSNKRRIFEVMDNTRCIFPAASKIATAAIIGEHVTSQQLLDHHGRKQKYPFITINPSFLHSVSGDELLVALDEIMSMAFTDSSSDDTCSFILPEEATSASWIDLVRSYSTSDTTSYTSSSLQSIPLYILVLSRFQYSLASSYAGRNNVPSLINDQNGDSASTSYKSSAKWLSAMMTRIHLFDNTESTEDEAKPSSKLPRTEITVEGNQKTKKYKLEDYLLFPFAVVAGRLSRSQEISLNHTAILKEIDSDIEESLREFGITNEKELSDEAKLLGAKSRAQSGDARTDSGTGLCGNESFNVTKNSLNSLSTSGGRKGKKKKKKKVSLSTVESTRLAAKNSELIL